MRVERTLCLLACALATACAPPPRQQPNPTGDGGDGGDGDGGFVVLRHVECETPDVTAHFNVDGLGLFSASFTVVAADFEVAGGVATLHVEGPVGVERSTITFTTPVAPAQIAVGTTLNIDVYACPEDALTEPCYWRLRDEQGVVVEGGIATLETTRGTAGGSSQPQIDGAVLAIDEGDANGDGAPDAFDAPCNVVFRGDTDVALAPGSVGALVDADVNLVAVARSAGLNTFSECDDCPVFTRMEHVGYAYRPQ